MMNGVSRYMQSRAKGLIALGVGLVGGLSFIQIGLSLPWVLGSLVACSLAALFGLKLAIPSAWRGYALAILGTILGSSFAPETLHTLSQWLPTLSVMLILTVVYFLISFKVLARWSGMNRINAIFSAIPGGLSIVSALADSYKADSRRIALSHSARLVALLALTPVVLHYVGNYELPASTIPLGQHAIQEGFSWMSQLVLLACAVSGWLLAKRLRFATGMLLFPLLFSAILHASGYTQAVAHPAAAALSQLVIGTSVGVRFVGYSWKVLIKDGWLSILVGIGLALLAVVCALALHTLTGAPFGAVFLVLLPGGAPEIGVMALALNIDPAIVTTHHLIRVLFLVSFLGWVTSRLPNSTT